MGSWRAKSFERGGMDGIGWYGRVVGKARLSTGFLFVCWVSSMIYIRMLCFVVRDKRWDRGMESDG
jgi:hypothetical protein